jgi:hypothetical protein
MIRRGPFELLSQSERSEFMARQPRRVRQTTPTETAVAVSDVLWWVGALLQSLFGIALVGAILYGTVWVVHALWRAT